MKKILITFTIFALSLLGFSNQVFATNELYQFGKAIGKDNANVLTGCASKEGKESILCIINIVVDVLSVGVGIFGVIGISIVGIQYLTAGGSEEKTRKAKRRMFEIIIGLAIYVVIYALLKWLGINPE